MRRVIPYGIRLGASGKVEAVPIAHVLVRSKARRSLLAIFLIDSGAATSLLSASEAEVLGLDLESGERVMVQGVTGHTLLGYRHTVSLVIEDMSLNSVPVIFADTPDAPAVLGREGVFPRFGILFDEAKRRVGFLDRREQKVIERILSA